ncbi:MAG: hypothetical protein WCA08_25365 [Desulfoferrobacter sp.]
MLAWVESPVGQVNNRSTADLGDARLIKPGSFKRASEGNIEMAIELRTGNSYGTPLRIASIVGAVVSVGLLIWMLVQHWQAFMTWKAEAGFWSFFEGSPWCRCLAFP